MDRMADRMDSEGARRGFDVAHIDWRGDASALGAWISLLSDDERGRVSATARRRTNRILRFVECQSRKRSWICFRTLAAAYGANVSRGYRELWAALMAGEFEEDGESRVLFLHPAVAATKLARGHLTQIVEAAQEISGGIERQIFGCCWVPQVMAAAWCVSRGLSPKECFESEISVRSRRRGSRGRPKGWRPVDDGVALEEMHKLVASGASQRLAAAQAIAVAGMIGDSYSAAIDRLRRKFRSGYRR